MRATLLLLLALPAGAQPRPAGDAPRYDDGVITATVKNTRGEPLAGAWVVLEGYSPAIRRPPPAPQPERISRHGATDAAGRVRFRGLPSGQYNLVQAQMAGRQFQRQVAAVALEGPKAQGAVEILLSRKPVLTGRVVDQAGTPLVHAQVKTFRRAFPNGRETLVPSRAGSTDDRGVYRIVLQEPGRYWLMASHSERSFPHGSAPRSTGVAFYPNSPDLLTAAPIEVASDQQERTLDLTLPAAPRTSLVAAIVSGPDAKPCVQCSYSLQRVEGLYRYEIVSGGAGRDAALSYAGVPPGLYEILVEDHGRNAGWWAIQEVVVADGRPTEALLGTLPPVSLSGRVILEEPPNDLPEPPEDQRGPIRVELGRDETERFFSGRGGDNTVQLALDETDFGFDGLAPIPYLLNAYVYGTNNYLAAVTRQGRPLPWRVVDLSQPGPWTNLELHVRFDLAELRIEVDAPTETDDGEPAQYRIEVSADPAEHPFGGNWSGQCGGGGRCQSNPLPPGRYRVVAVAGAPLLAGDSKSPETWEQLSPWVRSIDLGAGENPTLHLTPAPASQLTKAATSH